jgi:hypothetical protein
MYPSNKSIIILLLSVLVPGQAFSQALTSSGIRKVRPGSQAPADVEDVEQTVETERKPLQARQAAPSPKQAVPVQKAAPPPSKQAAPVQKAAPPPPKQAVPVQKAESSEKAFPVEKEKTYRTFSVGYHSWTERMTLDGSSSSDFAWASAAGVGIHYEQETFWGRTGFNSELGILFGTASGGGSSNSFNYTSPKTSYYGLQYLLKSQRRLTPQISFSLGPMLLYRSLSWKTDSNPGLKANSGADFNLGMVGELKIRLTPRWDLRQEIGALAFNATTFWLLGLGFKF